MFQKSFSKILNLFYPHLCLNCDSKLEKNYFYFCKNCLFDFSYIQPNKETTSFAVFEKTTAVDTLVKELKKQRILSITKIAAAFIVIQIFRLKWPSFDIVYPLSSLLRKDHLYYLSKETSLFLKIPMKKKQNLSQKALIVFDVLDIDKIDQIKEKLLFKKVYAIGLCFDVFFDDLDLSL